MVSILEMDKVMMEIAASDGIRKVEAEAATSGEVAGLPIIEIDELSFSYDLGRTNTLRNISFDLPEKEVTALAQ